MLKDKPTIRNRVVAKLYKVALCSKHFHASVTSEDYGRWLNQLLGTNIDFSIVRDVVLDRYYADLPKDIKVDVERNTVFCGGGNARDWPLMVKLAQAMKETRFYFVMRGKDYETYKADIPSNVVIYHDIKHRDFSEVLLRSEVSCIPLTSEAPSGLMVLFESAYRRRPVFITKTLTSSAYVDEEKGYPLFGREVDDWKQTIEHGFAHREEMMAKADRLNSFIANECSEKSFVKQLDDMIGKYVG